MGVASVDHVTDTKFLQGFVRYFWVNARGLNDLAGFNVDHPVAIDDQELGEWDVIVPAFTVAGTAQKVRPVLWTDIRFA